MNGLLQKGTLMASFFGILLFFGVAFITQNSLIAWAHYSFDGTKGSRDGSFTFDLTDLGLMETQSYVFIRLENEGNARGLYQKFQNY